MSTSSSKNEKAQDADRQSAVELARAKLSRVYSGAPNAKQELAEADEELAEHKKPSRHQEFMLELKESGKSIAEIQTDWNNYYQNLGDDDKRAVWREFYDRAGSIKWPSSGASRRKPAAENREKPSGKPAENKSATSNEPAVEHAVISEQLAASKPIARSRRRPIPRRRTAPKPSKIPQAASAANARRQLRAKHNLESLAFGLATGLAVILIFMFSFFNQRFIVPFIRPGTASAAPIILSPSALSPTKQPEIIIPKINLEIPLVFSAQTTDDSQIEAALENGVVHYPTTVLPGQAGNSAFFGHSSNNIFSPGRYKFAFALLHELQKGDTFYITYNKRVYVYKVYDRQIVDPSDVAVLNNVPGKTTATLITCDPPGTSLNRLVIWGEQISPPPSGNAQPAGASPTASKPQRIIGNGPSLWDRIWPF